MLTHENLLEFVKSCLPEGVTAEAIEITNAGVTFSGIGVRKGSITKRYPCGYLARMSESEIRTEMVGVGAELDEMYEKVNGVLDKGYLKDHLRLRLKPGQRPVQNPEAVTRPFLDMSMELCAPGPMDGSMLAVTAQLLESLDITQDEAFLYAAANTGNLPYMITGLKGFIRRLEQDLGGTPFATNEDDAGEIPLFIATTSDRWFGASVMMQTAFLQNFGKAFHAEKLVVLPSSVHEVLLMPEIPGSQVAVETLLGLVREVNRTEVAPQDFLSNSVYLFDVETMEYTIRTK